MSVNIVGIGFGIRSTDDKSTGVMPHLKIYDASSLAYRQGRTRRGSYAAYLDISHPDILMFLELIEKDRYLIYDKDIVISIFF